MLRRTLAVVVVCFVFAGPTVALADSAAPKPTAAPSAKASSSASSSSSSGCEIADVGRGMGSAGIASLGLVGVLLWRRGQQRTRS
jgi:hypothetical protein